jgi:glycosyltransferase involved in cell wall biosynthesis
MLAAQWWSAHQSMDISLIICTRNRASPLKRCLETIGAIECRRGWELVIVDNGSTDETAATIREFANAAPFPVRYVLQPLKGLSNARNAGLAVAQGTIIAFTDDDCYPQPDFLEQITRAFEDERLGFVSGRIMLHDPTDYPATINESTEPLEFASGRYLAPGAIKGANLAFRRHALEAAGGFDPLFGSGALFPSEDVDTSARVSMNGWTGAYDPRIVVSHHHGRKAADIRSLHKSYDIGRGAYHAKLALQDGAYRHALRGWRGLPRRVLNRPATLRWELAGALSYVRCWLSNRLRQHG